MLIVTHLKEKFQGNNFVYTEAAKGLHVTLFENNYLKTKNRYEAAIVFIIRKKGETVIQHDIYKAGLSTGEVWKKLFTELHLEAEEINMNR